MKQYKLIVSTDCAGLFSTPKDWEFMWGFLKDNPKFIGFEFLPWGTPLLPFWPSQLMRTAKKKGMTVVGIHGRVGKARTHKTLKSRIMTPIYNEMMVTTKTLLTDLAPKVDYILLHNTELKWPGIEQLVLKYKDNINCLQIENAYDGNDIEEIKNFAAFYKSHGLKVGFTFDLYHYMHTLPSSDPILTQWKEVLRQLEELIVLAQKNDYRFELHLPIGEAMNDSLPPEIGVAQFKELAKVINGRIDYLTIESHPHNNDFLMPSFKAKQRLQAHNKKNIEKMQESGLL